MKVLLPVDDSTERALAQARTLTDLAVEPVEAVVFHVFADNPTGATVGQVASVRRAQDHLEEAGIEVTLASSSGDPTDQILAAARERAVDLVCLAGRKRSPAGKILFGSVSRDVLLESDVPVLFCTAAD